MAILSASVVEGPQADILVLRRHHVVRDLYLHVRDHNAAFSYTALDEKGGGLSSRPQIIRSMGYSNVNAQLLTVPGTSILYVECCWHSHTKALVAPPASVADAI